jgi:hypothetical protein
MHGLPKPVWLTSTERTVLRDILTLHIEQQHSTLPLMGKDHQLSHDDLVSTLDCVEDDVETAKGVMAKL